MVPCGSKPTILAYRSRKPAIAALLKELRGDQAYFSEGLPQNFIGLAASTTNYSSVYFKGVE
jgi:hypothetical protein